MQARPLASARLVRILASACSVGAMALLAALTREPLVFPSLGPSAWLLFSSPGSPAAAPRRVLLGHAFGLLCGQLALAVTGLAGEPGALAAGVDGARVVAVTLALAASALLAEIFDAVHPPAAATTLIVALGVLQGPSDLAVMGAAILLFVGIVLGVERWLPRVPS